MSSANRYIAVLFLAAGAASLSGCHSSAVPPPVAAGGEPAGAYAPGSAGISGVLYRKNPVANDPVSIADGRRLFIWYNCYACHGPHGGGAIGPSLRDRRWRYGDSDGQIFASIAQGRPNGMPTWGNKIPEGQIWELVAYIKSLDTSREPNPPQEPADEATRAEKEFTSTAKGTPVAPTGRQ
jgi:cytochrome c oxidase cbb3-type subunit III